MLSPGDLAPDFAVGETTLYHLLESRRVAVYFFPRAFTYGCTREAGGFCREYDALQRSGGQVVGVSLDTQETSERFRETLSLPFPLVGDRDGRIARAYDARWPILGLPRRITYLVGRDRRILSAFRNERDPEAHVRHVTEALLRE